MTCQLKNKREFFYLSSAALCDNTLKIAKSATKKTLLFR